MEKANTNNPSEFWRTIENLGPKKKNKIPWEVLCDDGSVNCDVNDVLNCWKHDFENLLKAPPPENEEQLNFIRNIEQKLNRTQREWTDDNTNKDINCEFSKSEVATVIHNAKKGKAPGIDGVISDTLHNRTSINFLTALFNQCLDSGLMPSVWARGIITPIPKGAKGDSRTPLNYHGISLTCHQ